MLLSSSLSHKLPSLCWYQSSYTETRKKCKTYWFSAHHESHYRRLLICQVVHAQVIPRSVLLRWRIHCFAWMECAVAKEVKFKILQRKKKKCFDNLMCSVKVPYEKFAAYSKHTRKRNAICSKATSLIVFQIFDFIKFKAFQCFFTPQNIRIATNPKCSVQIKSCSRQSKPQ